MALQGWISLPATQRLFQSAGVDSEKAFAAAKQPGFKATVAKINIDGCAPQSKVSNVIISGYGDTNTDQLVEETAAAQGRTVEQARNQSSGGYFRSDHFSFAKVGIPVVLAEGGRDYINPEDANRYKGPRTYHMPQDEYSPSWDVSGTLDDINLWYGIGLRIANGDFTPNWTEQSPWKNRR